MGECLFMSKLLFAFIIIGTGTIGLLTFTALLVWFIQWRVNRDIDRDMAKLRNQRKKEQ